MARATNSLPTPVSPKTITVKSEVATNSISRRRCSTTEIFKSKAILLGSPAINRGILVSVAGILEEIKGLQFKNKKAAVFGCYGWSGESTKIMSENLEAAGFELVDDGVKVMWNPDIENVNECVEYGKLFAGKAL
jgi:anaerobic nitric oxide reductase flavorubredoxin